MFVITHKGRAHRFQTQELAQKCAAEIHRRTGVFVGIERDKAADSRNFHRLHFWRVESIESRKTALVDSLMALGTGARSPGGRELWRGVRNAPPAVRARYERLCRAVARYRIRGFI